MRSKDSSATGTGSGATERAARVAAAALLALAGDAAAFDYSLHGLVDVRAVTAPQETAWPDGGLGKTRYGEGDTTLRFGSAVLAGTAQPLAELLLVADLEVHTTDRTTVQALQAYARYRPVSTSIWRWSAKLGAFFPPVSLENEGLGWTSLWTITPSAINGWVGEELRTIGPELRLERRGAGHAFELGGAAFWLNDPAGELIAARGWALSDLVSGLGGELREPDAYAVALGKPVPLRFDPYQELDDRAGWHADLTWRAPRFGRVTLMRYDNRADPTTHTDEAFPLFSWRTDFWSLAGQARLGDIELIAQALEGATLIVPSPFFRSTTEFRSAFLLAGWDLGRWRPALRVDAFSTQEVPKTLNGRVTEHGNAVTAALSYRPRDWLRLTAEVVRVDSWRSQRRDEDRSPRVVGTQVQLAARFLF